MTDYEESDNFQKKFLGNGTANALELNLDGKSPGPTTLNINKPKSTT